MPHSKPTVNIAWKVLKERFDPDFEDFDFVIDKIKNTDKLFIDFSKISTARRWAIFGLQIEKNKEMKK